MAHRSLPLLEPYRLDTPLPAAFLMPSFVNESEEQYLLAKIEQMGGVEIGSNETTVTYRDKGTAAGWRTVKGRRSMYLGGQVLPKSASLVPAPMPDFLVSAFPNVLSRIARTGAFEEAKGKKPNHVLVNEYLPGQGIMPHEDGTAYYPCVTTLSLGSHTILDVYSYTEEEGDASSEGARALRHEPDFSILIPPRSLFVLTDELYQTRLHGIDERKIDSLEQLKACVNFSTARKQGGGNNAGERGRRVSLTCRCVERVRKLL